MEGAIKSLKAEKLLDGSNLRKYNDFEQRRKNENCLQHKSRYYITNLYENNINVSKIPLCNNSKMIAK